jgi:hypothetical protein
VNPAIRKFLELSACAAFLIVLWLGVYLLARDLFAAL